jgi:hypothetical protein
MFQRGTFAGLLLLALGIGQGAQAAPINLTPSYPDLTTFGATLSYSYVAVCARRNDASVFGVCNTGSGQNTFDGAQNWSLSYGRFTLSGNVPQTLNEAGSGAVGVTDSNSTASNYNLTVILGFNSTGTALSGILATDPWVSGTDGTYNSALSAFGTVAGNPNFQSGTIVTGTPVNATTYGYLYPFGYSGTGAAGTFEFVFDNIGGDFAAYAGPGAYGGIIVSTFNLTGAAGGWDAAGIGFWKTAHSGTANVDTFVPVPGAVWLFGSALAGLAALRRKANTPRA